MAAPEDYLQALTALGSVVLESEDLNHALSAISSIAAAAVPGAEAASLTTYRDGQPTATGNDDWARGLDEMQYAQHEGPCLDATRTGNVFRVRDFEHEHRWPFYGQRALDQGVRSMMSIPTTSEGRLIGALNVYSREPDAFSTEAVAVAEVVAAHAGLASQVASAFYEHRDLARQMAEAMKSRATIEQAKGILMRDRRCSPDEAFALLVDLSQKTNRKLREVAQAVVDDAFPGSDASNG